MCQELVDEAVQIGYDEAAYREFRRRWAGFFEQAGMAWIARVIAGQARRLACEQQSGRPEEMEALVNDLLFGFGVSLLQTARDRT